MQSPRNYAVCIDKAILGLLFIFFVCEHHVKFTAIKNLSLYLALVLALILFFYERKIRTDIFVQNFKNAKFMLICLSIFVFYALLISTFPYTNEFKSLKECFKEFGRGVAFLLIVLIYANGDEKKVRVFFYGILVAFIAISAYYLCGALPKIEHIDNTDFYGEAGRIVERAYAVHADKFAVFAFLAVVILKQFWLKVAFGVFCVIFVSMDILTGARGSYLSVAFAFIASVSSVFFSPHREFLKKKFKSIIICVMLACCVFGILIANSSIFSSRLDKGFYSSGRDLILKERLPLLMNSERAFWGIGYGFRVYDKFLEDKSKEKNIQISMMTVTNTGRKHWFNDEPYFIGNYYYYGFIGTLALFLATMSLLVASFREFRRTQNLLFMAIFISVISYFGVRGLFETMNLRILYIFYMVGFFIILKRVNTDKA